MDPNFTAALIGFATALITTAVPQIVQYIRDKRKQPLEDLSQANKIAADASQNVITYSGELNRVRTQLNDLQKEFDALKEERRKDREIMAEWQWGIDRLLAQFVSLNIKPVWTPSGKEVP